jgi:hypothetical protein
MCRVLSRSGLAVQLWILLFDIDTAYVLCLDFTTVQSENVVPRGTTGEGHAARITRIHPHTHTHHALHKVISYYPAGIEKLGSIPWYGLAYRAAYIGFAIFHQSLAPVTLRIADMKYTKRRTGSLKNFAPAQYAFGSSGSGDIPAAT